MLVSEVDIKPIRKNTGVESLKNVAGAAENALLAFFSTNMILSVFLSSLLQLLWSMINALQIIMLI